MKKIISLFICLFLLTACMAVPSREKVFSMDEIQANKKLFNISRERILEAWGQPQSFFSGLYGDIYEDPEDPDRLIGIQYDRDTDTVIGITFFDRQK